MADAPSIDPRYAALLVMDYQNGILEQFAQSESQSESLLARVSLAITVVRRHGGRIAYVRVGFEDADYAAIPGTSPMARAAASHAYDADSPRTAIHDAIAPAAGDLVVRKTRVGAFSTTDLHDQLHARGITTVILAGISTSGVVLSTVRDAADRDYRIVVLADACADRDPAVHAFLTERIFPRQATVATSAELEHMLSGPEL